MTESGKFHYTKAKLLALEHTPIITEEFIGGLKTALDTVPSDTPFYLLTADRSTATRNYLQREYPATLAYIEAEGFQPWDSYWQSLHPNQKRAVTKRFHGLYDALQTALTIQRPTIGQIRSLSLSDLPLDARGKTDRSSFSTVELFVEIGLLRVAEQIE